MTSTSTAGRIDEPAFKSVTGTLFGLAILTATIRTGYRVQSNRKLMLDDLMLIFACVTLTASIGLLFSLIPTLYWDEELILNPGSQALAMAGPPAPFLARVLFSQRMAYSFVVLTYATIFAVKICFLLFFFQMVDRLKKLMLFWKIVFGITLLFYCLCASVEFISCPHFGLASLTCAHGSGFTINIIFASIGVTLDIITDCLIIMIPILLLWKVKIKRSQKMLLGIFLCLSICMIMMAIVRISGARTLHTLIDVQWELFWQGIEAAISVIMISITAFRSLFGLKAQKSREKKERAWYSYRQKPLLQKGNKKSNSDLSGDHLPSIPGATLTGMRTLIQSNQHSKTMGSEIDEINRMTSIDDGIQMANQIRVTHKISSESETLPKEDSTAATNFV